MLDEILDKISLHAGISKITLQMVKIRLQDDFSISGGSSGSCFMPIVVLMQDSDGDQGIGMLDNFPLSAYDRNGTVISWPILKEEYIPSFLRHFSRENRFTLLDVYRFLRGFRDFNPFAISALEMAVWDLLGKKQGACCLQLFKKIFLNFTVEFSKRFSGNDRCDAVLGAGDHETRVKKGLKSKISIGLKNEWKSYEDSVSWALNNGIDTIKLKITPVPKYSTELLARVRNSYPELTIDTDANSSFIPSRSIDDVPKLEPIIEVYKDLLRFKPRMHEQPSIFTGDHLDIFERLQAGIATPLCADESLHGFYEARVLCDIATRLNMKIYANIKIHRVGGLLESLRILSYFEVFNHFHEDQKVVPWGGYMPDQELATNALLYLFTLPSETSETDATSHDYWFKDSVFDQSLRFNAGRIKPVVGDGFGLHLDDDEVEKRVIKQETIHV
ncbi:MAG: enolase C-terminal domain-like protein [Promethearchaeota archaeon]